MAFTAVCWFWQKKSREAFLGGPLPDLSDYILRNSPDLIAVILFAITHVEAIVMLTTTIGQQLQQQCEIITSLWTIEPNLPLWIGTYLDPYMYLPNFCVAVTLIIKMISSTASQLFKVHVSIQPPSTSKVSFEVTLPCSSSRLTTGCPQQRIVET